MDNERMNTVEASDYTRIPKRTLERLVREGKLPIIMITHRIRFFRKEDLDGYMKSRLMRAKSKTGGK